VKAQAKLAYVDSSAFIAFLDRSDSHHSLFALLFSEAQALITSSLVIAECHAWFLRRYDNYRALQFLNFISDLTPLKINSFNKEEIEATHQLVKKFNDQSLTLADAHGISLIKSLKIKHCWSTDKHFRLSGVPLIIDS
jgi:predicted nucleic acid-binding protein